MRKALPRILVLSAIGASLLVGFGLGLRSADDRIARMEQRLSVLEKAHRTLQDAFLSGTRVGRDHLARSLGYRRMSSGPPSETDRRKAPMSASEELAFARKSYQEYQRVFDAEVVNPAWSGTTRQNVEDVLYGIAQNGVVPRSAQIDCRSRSCKISLELNDTGEVDGLLEPLLTDIAADLPDARIVQMSSPDGQRIKLHIFATNAPLDPSQPRSF